MISFKNENKTTPKIFIFKNLFQSLNKCSKYDFDVSCYLTVFEENQAPYF